MAREDLEKNGMMRTLLEALEAGQDVGHYGRLVFTMVGRYFLDEDELIELLANDPACGEEQARSLVHQVRTRGYSPPRREKVLDFQSRQDFAFCDPADPDACNVYKDLEFPEGVYHHISEYHEQKQVAEEESGGAVAQP